MRSIAAQVALLSASAICLLAPQAAFAKEAVTAAEQAAVSVAVERGQLVFAYDRAAWLGTDDLLAKLKARDGAADPARLSNGWIVDGPAENPELVFYDKNEAEPAAIYIARFENGGRKLVSSRLLGPADGRALSPERKRLIAARRAAGQDVGRRRWGPCAEKPFNTVVLPPAAGGPTLVYFLTPQTTNEHVPAGGHYRVEIGADGAVSGARAFTNSCIDVPLKSPRGDDDGFFTLTHLLDPVPTEVHVFTMLASRRPLVVVTEPGRVWAIDAAKGEARIASAGALPAE